MNVAKSQVGLDETGQQGPNFPKMAIDINSLEIHFGCALSISDSHQSDILDLEAKIR